MESMILTSSSTLIVRLECVIIGILFYWNGTALEGSDIIENGFEYWLSILVNFLDRKLPGSLTDINKTSRSLQFKFEYKIDVDMLVSPFYREPRTLYRFLQRIEPGQQSM